MAISIRMYEHKNEIRPFYFCVRCKAVFAPMYYFKSKYGYYDMVSHCIPVDKPTVRSLCPACVLPVLEERFGRLG